MVDFFTRSANKLRRRGLSLNKEPQAVKEEEEPVPVYVNIEEFRKESSRGRVNSQPHSSTSTFEEWETHTDEESGQLFYYNSLTRETTWDSPFDQSEEQTHSPISSPSPSLVLSESDWEKHFDEVTRQFYFYNSVTGDTSWDPPPDEDLNLPEMKPVLSSYRSMEKRPPTPEADYPEYPDDICNYPDTDYLDNHEHFEPVFPGNTSDDQTTGWYSQIGKEGKTFYKNYSNETINYPPDPYRARSESDSDNKNVSTWHIASRQTESKGLVKAGVLHKTKIAENGKRIRKSWTSSWTVLEGDILTFYKDGKNLSSNSLKLSSSLTTPEHTVRLNGAKLEWASKEKSSKKNVVMLKTNDGSEYLIHHDSESIAASWFSTIKSSIGRNSTENVYEAETFPEVESIEKLGIKDDKEKRLQASHSTTSINSDSDRNVRAKLKKFLQRRPTLQSVRDKGYIKDQVFGCHLHQLCEGEKQNVPAFVTKAIAAVEKRGLDIDGLYRVSGNLATIQKLRYKVDHDENINLEDGRWQDVHVITGALKLFFRELPEPLFPYSHFDRFIETIKITDQNQRKYQIKELVMSLPAPNLETMRVLFKHLCSVIEHRESNRMSVQSIAIVFGPTLLRPETEGASIAMFMVFQSQIVEQILLQYKYIFNS
ncbi:rho GTPase-activating protein 27 isoform X2 [Bombina bombina]|uniref:rho GTPase-activating protein 27 isoform X2 n=1 Tax=Bombina bombina TaxID=8345 RepID=UPI00235A95FF|nr:rho GTPase-activating protein 27 isoform X2 [Bombina bombina]